MASASPQEHRSETVTRRFEARRDAIEAEAGVALSELFHAGRDARPHPHVERALAHALRSRWDRAAAVERCAIDSLLLAPALAALAGQPAAVQAPASPEPAMPLPDTVHAAIDCAASSELFGALVQCAPVGDLRIERLLLSLRRHLTEALPVTPHEIRVAAMIATQARRVEYLWPDEASHVAGTEHLPHHSPHARALMALVEAMHRAPGAAGVAAIATLDGEPAVHELVTLVRDDPAIEASYRRRLESSGDDAVLLFRSAPATPTGVGAAPAPADPIDAMRLPAVPAGVRALAADTRFDSPRLLLVGCHDAREPVAALATWPGAHITAIDWSATRLVDAMRTWESAVRTLPVVGTVDFVVADLLEIPDRDAEYDIVQCTANTHYLPQALPGCVAFARCTRPGSLLRLVAPSNGGRRRLRALQEALGEYGFVSGLSALRVLRERLLDGTYGPIPQELLAHPDFFTAGGMRRLLFAHDDDVPDAQGWIPMVESVGFRFVCVEGNDVLRHAARSAGAHDCDGWNVDDWERFERDRPAMFGGEYSLWFVRCSP